MVFLEQPACRRHVVFRRLRVRPCKGLPNAAVHFPPAGSVKEWIDDEALDFPEIAEAAQHAREIAAELAWNQSPSELQDCFVVVRNMDGTEVIRVPLGKTRSR